MIHCGEGIHGHQGKIWSFKPLLMIVLPITTDHISGPPGLLLNHGAEGPDPHRVPWPGQRLRVIAPEKLPFEIRYKKSTVRRKPLNGTWPFGHNVLCYGYSIEIDRQAVLMLH